MPSPEFNEAMRLALDLAAKASQQGDVPVGAIVLNPSGEVVGQGFNTREADNDPMSHAEVVALREAAIANGSWRLDDHTLVVTLEPCTMCAGAILNSRISRLVFGASEPKTGAAGSVHNVFLHTTINHQTSVLGGVMADESKQLLQQFFKPKRMNTNPLREDALRPQDEWFEGVEVIGVSSGASVPEILVTDLIKDLARRGYGDVETVTAMEEHLLFSVPPELRKDLKAAGKL